MRVNRRHHVVERRFKPYRRHWFSEDFRRQWPDRVHSEYFAILLFGHNFNESLMMADDRSLAVAGKRKFASLNFNARVARLLLGHSNRADLRLAVCSRGAAPAVERLHFFACHSSDGD